MKTITELKSEILKLLDDKKVENIIEIDVSKSNARLSDVCIIGTGTSSRHTESVADYVYRFLKSEKEHPLLEGSAKTGWVMIESSGIEIHLFKPELREYYDLESIMMEGKRPPHENS